MAVMGHKGVGKSTVIKRASKAWGASEPVIGRTNRGFDRESAGMPLATQKETRRLLCRINSPLPCHGPGRPSMDVDFR
jgi:hypothetical protein